MLTRVRLRGGELRAGDIYVTSSDATRVKRKIIECRETVARGANGRREPAIELACADGTTPILLRSQWVRAERDLRPLGRVTAEDRRAFAEAHIEGLHDELPREFCPECEAQR